jgi:hypothetical protein
MRVVLFICLAALVAISAARAAGLSDKEMVEARKLYTVKCAKCHKFYDPTKYNDEEWQMWMRKMSKKAKLKEVQSDLLSRYLDNIRKGGTNSNVTAKAKP